MSDWQEFSQTFLNIVVPVIAGLIYLAMAKYVHHIGPMRTLITGELTYRGAYWGFLFMGIYLASRPVQILFPHPWPLWVNNIREFSMIGIFGPAVFLAMMSLVFGAENIPRTAVWFILALGSVLGALFMLTNVYAVGGSEPIFRIGRFVAHDGLWFKNSDETRLALMTILFVIRVIDPISLVFLAGTVVFWHARTYPIEKKILYDNMPRKLYLLGLACYVFSLSMLLVGILTAFDIPNQWWIYYMGALAAGFLETLSLALPMKKHVQVSEHL